VEAATPAVRPPAPDAAPAPIPPGGLQQELPYLDSPPEPAAAREDLPTPSTTESALPERATAPRAEADTPPATDLRDTSQDENVLPAVEQKPEQAEPAGLAEGTVAAAEVGDLLDIPVLEDAVELADALATPEMHASLPAADDARRIVIQVAARLNVDLRKEGKPGLSSDVIARLVRLLTEALAKTGANMDNNPSEKN
jgi:hypothetical protein